MSVRQQQIADVLLALLPMDGSMVGNASLFDQLKEAGRGLGLRVSDDDFQVAVSLVEDALNRLPDVFLVVVTNQGNAHQRIGTGHINEPHSMVKKVRSGRNLEGVSR